MAIWQPDLTGRQGPKYKQIADAIGEEIAAGTLDIGSRLPPQRELAYALGISPNTTSRAYDDAIKRGFLQGEVGRGTFVRAPGPLAAHADVGNLLRPLDGPIDLSRNLPAPGYASDYLARTLEAIGQSRDPTVFLDYQTEHDLDHHTEAAVHWLSRFGVAAAREEVIVSCGAQNATLVAFLATLRPGDILLTEELTYAPIKSMAAHLGLRLAPVRMDQQGLSPDALAEACQDNAVTALHCMPTLQTPTTLSMGAKRRIEIAEIACKHDLVVFEDDVFGLLTMPQGPAPLASLIPERTIYLTSTSKTLAPGLRVGYMRAPVRWIPALRAAVNLTCWMPPPLMIEVATRWISDGTADRLAAAQRSTATVRQRRAREILEGHRMTAPDAGMHLWLELPSHWKPDIFRAEAAARGVLLTEGATFAVDPTHRLQAVRLALSHEPSMERLDKGLTMVRDLLLEPSTDSTMIL